MDRVREGMGLGGALRDAARAQQRAAEVVQHLSSNLDAYLPHEEAGEIYLLPPQEATALVAHGLLKQEFAAVEAFFEVLELGASAAEPKLWLASVFLQAEELQPLLEGNALVTKHLYALLGQFLQLQRRAERPKRWWHREAPAPQGFLYGFLEQVRLLAAEGRL